MRYVALLRAVNVGGRTVKMDRLRALFEELALRNVDTFIASGNVIFESPAKTPALEAKIEKHLARALGFDVPTLVRAAADFQSAAERDAFAGHPALATPATVYVGFLKSDAAPDGLQKIAAVGGASNAFALHGRELYWRASDRRAAEIPIAVFERALGCAATFRNMTTVQKIAERYCR